MAGEDDIVFNALLDTADFDSGMEVLTGALRRVGEIAVDTFLQAGAAVLDFASDSFQGALEAEETMTRIQQVITSTGEAAGLTAEDVSYLGDEFAYLAGGSDDAVLAIEEMALRMGNITKDEMPDFIQTTLDLAAATGVDAVNAARLMAQAQEDPLSVMARLQKQGILFSEDLRDQAAEMVKAGDTAGAYALVMDRVGEATAGAAEAQAGTLSGQMEIIKNTFSEAGESIIAEFLPSLHEFTEEVLPVIIPYVKTLAAKVGDVITAFLSGQSPLSTFKDYLARLQPVIQTVSSFWSNTLLPALQNVWAWIQAELLPLFQQIWSILLTGAQTAIPQLVNFWNGVLMPALLNFWTWTQANILPLLSTLWDWIKVNLPVAIQTLVDFYNNVWLPAQIAITTWVINNVFPMLATLFDWLKVNIPIAIQTLSDFWTNTLQPAITQVWGWMTGTLFPMLSELWTWLSTTITAALTSLSTFWTGTLLPAITSVWSWMTGTLFPFFKELVDFLNAGFTLALTAIAGIWEKVVLPAIENVWKMFNDNVMPIIKTIAEYLDATFGPAFKTIGDYISGAFSDAVSGLVNGALAGLRDIWAGINQGIQDATKWLGEMAAKLATIKLPDWMTPGSPTPWEMGLRGISAAMDDLSKTNLPTLTAQLKMPGASTMMSTMAAPGVTRGGGAVSNSSQVNNYNLSLQTQRSDRSVLSNFYHMRAMGGV